MILDFSDGEYDKLGEKHAITDDFKLEKIELTMFNMNKWMVFDYDDLISERRRRSNE